MPTPKQLVFLFDGTNNTADMEDEGFLAPTNVKKFKDAIAYNDNNPKAYYVAGVGTRVNEEVAGAVWGAGIADRLQEAYRFLTRELTLGGIVTDYQVYILGFSRGAYIARVFSWLLTRCGIPNDASECEDRYDLFEDKKYDELQALKNADLFQNLKIEMVGVWDTVKTANYNDYNDCELAPIVQAGYHAMSIDEKRAKFPVTQWESNSRVKQQIWFAGVHSDIGGGYAKSGLSDITLQWMFDNAGKHGLGIRDDYKINPDPCAIQHESYEGLWATDPLRGGEKARKIESSELAHESVKTRIAQADYHPSNLPEDIAYTN